MPSVTSLRGMTTTSPYGFAGEQQFREADGLVFLRARYYDPSVGRFVSRDPILLPMVGEYESLWFLHYLVVSPQRLHPYAYVRNNPINRIDPTGLTDRCLNEYRRCKAVARRWYRLCKAGVIVLEVALVASCVKICKLVPKCLTTCLANVAKTVAEAKAVCRTAYIYELGVCRAEYEECRRRERERGCY
jgi:RHS repeat-associated protein